MDPLIQRLQIAQEFCQELLTLLSLPIKPQPQQVQGAIDMANAKLKTIEAIEAKPAAPFVPPVFQPTLQPVSK